MKKVFFKLARFIIKLLLPIIYFGKVDINSEYARKNIKKLCKEKEIFEENDVVNLEINEEIDLSIIIPVYNVENYLEECLESVVTQNTKYNFEIIVINDGSTDNSLDILKRYERKYRYFKIINQQNKGVSEARNVGINNCRGKFITFIDSDDYIEDGYIEEMLDLAIKDNIDIVMCSIKEYDINSKKIIKLITRKNILIKDGIKDEILNLKGYAWGKIYKRELWQKVRFPVGYLFEDTIIRSIIMRLCKTFEFTDKVSYVYRIRKESLSRQSKENRKNEKYLEQYFLQEKILELSSKIGLTKDKTLYKILLYELGVCLWRRNRFFSRKIKKDIFVLSCSLIQKYRVESKGFNFEYKYLEKAFEKRNFVLWELISIYIIIGEKIGN